MDLGAVIAVIIGTVLFFGFIVLMAIYTRRKNREKLLTERPEINFSEVRKKNLSGLKTNPDVSAPEIR